jgi:uncharacterized membrane protein
LTAGAVPRRSALIAIYLDFPAELDGSVVVGNGATGSGPEAFRWTFADDMEGLGDLDGGLFASNAYAVSPDGSTIVGTGYGASGFEAIIWDEPNGMRSIKQILEANGLNLTGWTVR